MAGREIATNRYEYVVSCLKLYLQRFSSGFTTLPSRERCIPQELSTPLCRLKGSSTLLSTTSAFLIFCTGHKSIVNTTLMHPYLPLLLTAGVERHILMHSPTSTCPCAEDLQLTPTDVRELPGPNVNDRRRMIRALTSGRDPDDDENTIALFDECVS